MQKQKQNSVDEDDHSAFSAYHHDLEKVSEILKNGNGVSSGTGMPNAHLQSPPHPRRSTALLRKLGVLHRDVSQSCCAGGSAAGMGPGGLPGGREAGTALCVIHVDDEDEDWGWCFAQEQKQQGYVQLDLLEGTGEFILEEVILQEGLGGRPPQLGDPLGVRRR